MGSRLRLAILALVEFIKDSLHGEPLGVLPVAGLCRSDNAGRKVCDAGAVLVLVPVLAASARARVPFQLEIRWLPAIKG